MILPSKTILLILFLLSLFFCSCTGNSIHGIVYYQGKACAGGSLRMISADKKKIDARLDAKGKFSIQDVSEGDYLVVVQVPNAPVSASEQVAYFAGQEDFLRYYLKIPLQQLELIRQQSVSLQNGDAVQERRANRLISGFPPVLLMNWDTSRAFINRRLVIGTVYVKGNTQKSFYFQ